MFAMYIAFVAMLFVGASKIAQQRRRRRRHDVTAKRNPRKRQLYVPANVNTHAKTSVTYRYKTKEYIMTSRERAFYRRLFSVVGREFLIFPQIHLSTLFAHDEYRQNYKGALSTIQRKSVDYVLCDTEFRVRCAIELDDETHQRSDRVERDVFVNQLFRDAGLPLVRVAANSAMSDDDLRNAVIQCLHRETPTLVYSIR